MIQRIQSLYLLTAAINSVAVFVATWGTSTVFSALVVMCVLVSLVSIFSYKNRKMQVKICYMNIFLLVAALGAAIVWMLNKDKIIPFNFLLGLSLVFVALAIYAIQKDENLIKSLDRIR